jgi:6-phosphofructokinase 1
MGRSAGWLAMTIGMSAGDTVTIIPEEFEDRSKFQHVLDVIEGAILKRRVLGRPDGVALVAEGLAYKLGDREELEALLGREVPLDAAGHPRLSEVDLARLIKQAIERRFRDRGQKLTIVDHKLGYELRSADPSPYDMGYCRSLGYFCIQMLCEGKSQVMASVVNGNLEPIHFHDMIDPLTNRTRTRTVNVLSDSYRVARAYQIRLERADLDNADMLARLAAEARMPPEEFKTRYARAATRLANHAPTPPCGAGCAT